MNKKRRARIILTIIAALAAGGTIGAGVGAKLYPPSVAVVVAVAPGLCVGVFVYRLIRQNR